MYRGCLSDGTQSRVDCQFDSSKCVKCNTTGCNNQPSLQIPTLSCVFCKDDKECAFGQLNQKTRKCQYIYEFPMIESCFAHSINGTDIVERGCTLDTFKRSSDWCNESNNCQTCNESGCNIENVQYHRCYSCESDRKGECAVASDNHMKKCNGIPYPYSKRGCFTMIKSISILFFF